LEVTVDVLGYLKNFPNKRYVASRSNKAWISKQYWKSEGRF
jgi:hypothetical protein